MRPVLHGDVSSAARVLLTVPQQNRDQLCARMISEADLAHRYVTDTGRLHPVYGNGSLMAAARCRRLANEPGFDNVQYCQCFETVLRHLIRFHVTQTHS